MPASESPDHNKRTHTSMASITLPRVFSLYYSLVAAYICWVGIIKPVRALLRGFGDWLSIPFGIIPAFVIVLFMLFTAYSVYAGLAHSYETAVMIHCGLFTVIVFLFLASRSTAIIALTVHACVLVLYLFPRTQRAFALASQQQSQAPVALTKFVNRMLVIGLSVAALGIVAWCGISEYAGRTMSAHVVMSQLLELPPDMATDAAIREALFTQVPRGTSKMNIRLFLESKNVPRDQFVGGQLTRYQVEQYAIVALFTDPPWTFSWFCSRGNSGIRFVLDAEGWLTDIVMEDYSVCL